MPTAAAYITIDRSQPATIVWCSPSGLAVIGLQQDGKQVDTVAHLHAVRVIPEYQAVADRVVGNILQTGMQVMVQGSAASRGSFQEIPVVDVILADRSTLGEHLVRLGYAVPNEAYLSAHLRSQQLTESVIAARVGRIGAWIDHTPAQLGMSAGLATLTQPQPQPPTWFTSVGVALLLIVIAIAGVRTNAHRRQREAEEEARRKEAEAAGKPVKGPGVIRRTARFVFGLPAGTLKPVAAERTPPKDAGT